MGRAVYGIVDLEVVVVGGNTEVEVSGIQVKKI